jgi:hypothetical protein
MTAAKDLRPVDPAGLGSRDLQQALTANLIQNIYVSGWLWRWEQVLACGLASDHIRSGLAYERNLPSPVVLRVHDFHRVAFHPLGGAGRVYSLGSPP